MAVHEHLGMLSQGLDDWSANGQIGNVVPIHDIHVQPIGTAFLDELGLRRQIGEVGGEHGGRNLRAWHLHLQILAVRPSETTNQNN